MSVESAALVLARAHIAEGATKYICYALQYVGEDPPHLAQAANELQDVVLAGIAPWFAFDGWLQTELSRQPSHTTCQLARLAWLDKLILEYAP